MRRSGFHLQRSGKEESALQFHKMLNEYLRRLNVTALELATASELSPPPLSAAIATLSERPLPAARR